MKPAAIVLAAVALVAAAAAGSMAGVAALGRLCQHAEERT